MAEEETVSMASIDPPSDPRASRLCIHATVFEFVLTSQAFVGEYDVSSSVFLGCSDPAEQISPLTSFKRM